MNMVRTNLVRGWTLLASVMITATLLMLQLPVVADLMRKFGISSSIASTITNLVASGAIWLLVYLFPWISPYTSVLKALLAYGKPYLISW